MVNTNNKNQFISRVSKMLKPLLRRLSKRSSRHPVEETCVADFSAENAANEALEARLQSSALPAVTVLVTPPHHWCLAAPDRDLLSSPSCQGVQTPCQQSPSPSGIQLQEDQEWW
ncbi:hypothetical protein B566_EDAN013394 [Ephemera danica]|nr:hypothetical protein B566_EDAN013394 [Ephemera danica]